MSSPPSLITCSMFTRVDRLYLFSLPEVSIMYHPINLGILSLIVHVIVLVILFIVPAIIPALIVIARVVKTD